MTNTTEIYRKKVAQPGHVSWQKHVIEFDRTGYGLRYGDYYGGA